MAPVVAACMAAVAVLAICLVFIMRHEAGGAVLETIRLTDGDGGLRIAQLSDIHIKYNQIPLSKVISLFREASPHIVALTGDYIDAPDDAGPFLEWIGALIDAAGGATFYLCFGNHDEKAFTRSPRLKRDFIKNLKKLGVYILDNRTLSFSHNGGLYAITGFSDYYSKPYVGADRALKGAPGNVRYHIGISHNPDIAMELAGPRPDLLLLGHFHGGQIWLPFHLEYICLRKEILCKRGFRRGLYGYGGRHIYISRGLGCVLFPLRLGSRPEITLFIVL